MTKATTGRWTVIHISVWPAIGSLVVSGFVGFMLGTEYQHNTSLKVIPSELPGLLIDKGIFDQALKAEESNPQPDVLTVVHLKSSLNLIESEISQLSSKN